MAKKNIAQIVNEEKEEILNEVKEWTDIRRYAKEKGWDNRSAFPRFKKALLEIGIDAEAMKRRAEFEKKEEKEAEKKSIKHRVILYSDYKKGTNRFCVHSGEEALWFGIDFDDPEHQAAGELNAAAKAVWLAGKIREKAGLEKIKLDLYVDAEWLTYQYGGAKGYKLTKIAEKNNIFLSVHHISGDENPADHKTTSKSSGYRKWSDNSGLEKLVKEEEEDAA